MEIRLYSASVEVEVEVEAEAELDKKNNLFDQVFTDSI